MRMLMAGVLAAAAFSAPALAQQTGKGLDRQVITATNGQTVRGVIGSMGVLYIVPEKRYRVTGSTVKGALSLTYQGAEGIRVVSTSRSGTPGATLKLTLEDGRKLTIQIALQASKQGGFSYLMIR